MPLAPSVCNYPVNVAAGSDPGGIVDHFSGQPREVVVVGNDIPYSDTVNGGHLQGVTILGSSVVLTTSAANGHIIKGLGGPSAYVSDEIVPVVGGDHPGGLQGIGDYVAIPVYTDTGSEIRFYHCASALTLLSHLTVALAQRALCVGVTNHLSDQGDRYLLAVAVRDKRLQFFETTSGVPLSDPNCQFGQDPIATWALEDVPDAARQAWKPDEKWRGYENAIGLLTDVHNNLYFVGLHRAGLFGLFRSYADLYRLDLSAPAALRLQKTAGVRVHCKNGPSFRWGAAVRVTDQHHPILVVCERNVNTMAGRRIRLNVFE